MKPKYTPGPWEVFSDSMHENGVKAATSPHNSGLDFVICDNVRGDYRDNPTGGSPQANANLIAAAPELLEALEYANRFLKKEDVDKDFIEKAIAKAKGE